MKVRKREVPMRRKRLFTLCLLLCFMLIFLMQGRIETSSVHAPPPPSDPRGELTVVTYNIRGCRNDVGEADALAIAGELKKLRADLISLQEVDNGLPRSGFVDQAKTIASVLHMNDVFAPAINFFVGTYGIALLSHYPIVSATSLALPSHREPRILLEAEVNVGGRPLHVFTTHLGLTHAERAEQFDYLYHYLRNQTGQTAILLGDFNTQAEDPLLTPIRTLFDDPLFRRKQRLLTINGRQTRGMIDHIFLSPDLRFLHAYSPTTGRSDHHPVIFRIQLLPKTPDNSHG
jgi:endonuclease/exonuclease/phosphatase family metal-dependent hydrolase